MLSLISLQSAMSFREIRNLVEHLRVLGFPRMVSLENFSLPNFQLVSEILAWAVTTVDSDHDLNINIESEHDRVIMVRFAAMFFYTKLGVHLNTLKLYAADKLAVRELLKITTCVYKAAESALLSTPDDHHHCLPQESSPVVSVKELREVRQLASSIIMDAASLCDSLKQDEDNKMKRLSALDKAFDLDFLEASVIAALHALASTVADIKEASQALVKEGEEIVEKIRKKRESLTRNEKRLETLLKIKPAWQTEFEEEEAELRAVWDEYITKHKSLAYLEEELQQLEKRPNHHVDTQLDMTSGRSRDGAVAWASISGIIKLSTQEATEASHRIFGNMTGESFESSGDSDTVDSLLVDSGSEDDSLTFMSAAGTSGPSLKQCSVVSEGASIIATVPGLQATAYSLPFKPMSSRSCIRPPSARLKSSQKGIRVSSLTAWTSVKGSDRVSPLSASEDNSDDAF
ncbi:clusterin-associated protein 1 isoform X2 [Cherax quadricarinatus]|uniref:clusterin-associated protein 1 isoform X2 n=1 Tax=Cherax quadricarinatus TaxID=27406 RepID=UPI00387E3177